MNKFRNLLKSLSFALGSNIISFLISAVVTFIVPKRISIENYGFFQLYIFYTSYIGFLHLGWSDGICLRYGGNDYSKLNYSKFSGQFWVYSFIEVFVGTAIFAGSLLSNPQVDRNMVLMFTGISVCLVLPKTMLHSILYSTNRIREYAIANIGEKIIYISLVIFVLLMGEDNYKLLILSDFAGKLFSSFYVFINCKDIILAKPCSLKDTFYEAYENIRVGINVMVATIAGNLIVGIVRLSISNVWDAEVFGKVSLTISVSNMLLLMVSAVSLVMFPLLKRVNESKLNTIYYLLRASLMIPLLGMLTLYYPAKLILSYWLPEYQESLNYMALLFPVCVFSSKNAMLIDTYLKALRKEKWLLLVNVITLSISAVFSFIFTYQLHNLDLAVASIVLLIAFRCVFSELLLSTVLKVNVKKDILFEVTLTSIFIISSWFIGGIFGLMIYTLSYLIYLIIKRDEIMILIKKVNKLFANATNI